MKYLDEYIKKFNRDSNHNSNILLIEEVIREFVERIMELDIEKVDGKYDLYGLGELARQAKILAEIDDLKSSLTKSLEEIKKNQQ